MLASWVGEPTLSGLSAAMAKRGEEGETAYENHGPGGRIGDGGGAPVIIVS